MKQVQLQCAAKLNLTLDVTGKREDGYHTLASIFQSVGVYDRMSVSVEAGNDITLTCDVSGIPCDARNLAYRAAKAFLDAAGMQRHVTIHLEKGIPSGAGMGGGSADAAGVLYALNLLLDCGYSNSRLREIGVALGADVPFMLLGGTAFAQGIGEILTPLRPLPTIPLVILKGTQSISTAAAYAALDREIPMERPDNEQMLRAIAEQDLFRTARGCCNVFESAADCSDVVRAKKVLREYGALQAAMTGSGSAVFGIFETMQKAEKSAQALRGKFPFVKACTTVQEPFLLLTGGVSCIINN